MSEQVSAKAAIEVTAGLVPGQPQPELTRQWWISSDEWASAEALNAQQPAQGVMPVDYVGRLMADKQGAAMAYAQLLMFQPDQYNFVTVNWLWF